MKTKILELKDKGKSIREIAEELNISKSKVHRILSQDSVPQLTVPEEITVPTVPNNTVPKVSVPVVPSDIVPDKMWNVTDEYQDCTEQEEEEIRKMFGDSPKGIRRIIQKNNQWITIEY